jgi:hypothetical protein
VDLGSWFNRNGCGFPGNPGCKIDKRVWILSGNNYEWRCLWIQFLYLIIYSCSALIDLFSESAVWQELEAIDDPELRELAKLLLTVVLRSRTPSTLKKYSGAFLRWKTWAQQKYEVAYFPASPIQVSLYLNSKTINQLSSRRGSKRHILGSPSRQPNPVRPVT